MHLGIFLSLIFRLIFLYIAKFDLERADQRLGQAQEDVVEYFTGQNWAVDGLYREHYREVEQGVDVWI